MNKTVLEMFSGLLKEFEKGEILIDCPDGYPYKFQIRMNYQIHFNNSVYTNATEDFVPCLHIQNLEKFIKLLEKSIEVRWNFHYGYFPEAEDEAYKKGLIAMTFVNMTENDFKNPEQYLEDLINSYNPENSIFEKPGFYRLGEVNISNENYGIGIHMDKADLGSETPYFYTICLFNGIDAYYFPSIYAMKSDDKLIIRAIQNEVGEEYISDDNIKIKIDDYIKNNLPKEGLNNKKVSYLRNVTPSFVVGLNSFIEIAQHQKREKIKTLEFPLYSPLRYHNKLDTLVNKLKSKLPKDDPFFDSELQKIEEWTDNMQSHISDKFLFTLLRMQYHLPHYEILDYGDVGSVFKMKINKHEKKDDVFDKFAHPSNPKIIK